MQNTANATGWPSSKSDPGGTIGYQYRADGNVKQVTAPGNYYTTMTYDAYGNQLTLNDPSAGNSSYTYYGGGELHTQTTPLGTSTYNYTADGRIDLMIDGEGNEYDYIYNVITKKLWIVNSPGGVSRTYTYYTNGKVRSISETIEAGQTNKVTFVYDGLGRVSSKAYTNTDGVTYTEEYVYNGYGYLDQIFFNGLKVYDVNTMNKRGQITEADVLGGITAWGYNQHGQLTSSPNGYSYSYNYNATTGNISSRSHSYSKMDITTGITTDFSLNESFYYDDDFDRLDYVKKGLETTLDIDYDNKGNIASLSDLGSFKYDLPNKPYHLSRVELDFHPPGVPFVDTDQDITYTSFGKVSTIDQGSFLASFKYNCNNERVKITTEFRGEPIKIKYYFGESYEKVIRGFDVNEYIWIGGSPYTAPVVANIRNGIVSLYFVSRDHLGSIVCVMQKSSYLLDDPLVQLSQGGGSGIIYYSFDAYGRCRNSEDWSNDISGESSLIADRGYTGHEHLEYFDLINMNGRIYDPEVARFLSPDNYVQAPGYTQSYNRYAYCLNNPLRYTDPSGEFVEFLIAGAFYYLKGAHDNRDKTTGKWAWNPVNWFGKDQTGFVVGVNSNTDFTNVNYYAGLYSPDYSPVLAYNPDYGVGMGNVVNPGYNTFYYPSYTDKAGEVAGNFVAKANAPSYRIGNEGFFSDGIWTFGFTGTASGGMIGASAEVGLTLDFRKGFKLGGYLTLEHAVGADLSAGLILNYHKPIIDKSIFGIPYLHGWGESYNGALPVYGIFGIDGTYGGNAIYPGLDPQNYNERHSLFYTYGFGVSVGTPLGFTRNKGYTWETPTFGW